MVAAIAIIFSEIFHKSGMAFCIGRSFNAITKNILSQASKKRYITT